MPDPPAALTIIAEDVPGFLSFTDNGDGSGSLTGTPGCGDPGQYTIRFIASDGELADTCYITITVNPDNEDPVAICPGNITVDNDPGQPGAVVYFSVDATDNCPGAAAVASPPSGSFFPIGTTPVEVIATDASGNRDTCYFNVTVNLTENNPPDITCPDDLTVDIGDPINFTVTATDDGLPSSPLTMSAEDYPGSLSFVDNGDNSGTLTGTPGCADPGQYTVRFIASDGELADTCFVTITVNEDGEDPVITSCPENMTVDTDPGQCYATVGYSAEATDNCPDGMTIVYDPPSGSQFPVGSPTTVTVTAEDAAGNSAQCFFTVTVEDNEDPVIISCPENMTVDTDPGQCYATVNYEATATDNCPVGLTITYDPPSGSQFFQGSPTTVTVTAEDAAGNTDQCFFTVTVEDNEDPELTCPESMTVDCDPGQSYATVTYAATVSDNCGVADVVYDPPSGSTFAGGTTTPVAVMATDVNGRFSICAFNVTVNPCCDCLGKGDVNDDGSSDPLDVQYLVNYVYLSLDALTPRPSCPYPKGDMNCDNSADPLDVTYLVNYVYLSLDALCDGCSD